MLFFRNIFRRFIATSQCHHCSVFHFVHLWNGNKGFSGGSVGKESTCSAGDVGLIPGLPRGRHGNPLQYSCLKNPMDRGAWWAIQSIGSQKVGHDWRDWAQMNAGGGNNNSSFLMLAMAGIRVPQKQARLPERRRKVVFNFKTSFWCFRKGVLIIRQLALCFEIPGLNLHLLFYSGIKSCIWMLLEGFWRPVWWGWLVAFWHRAPGDGAVGQSTPHHIQSGLLICLKTEDLLGPSSWVQHVGSLQIWHYFNTNVNLTQIMMQPVTQPIYIILGKEIAQGGPWVVGGQKEIFSSN